MEKKPYNFNFLNHPVPITEQKWPEDTIPLVSTSTNTYNQANYIRDCIEGILMQKTTFPVRVVIFDDASTDGTREIVKEYENKYPNLIAGFYPKKNTYKKPERREAVKPRNKFRNVSKYIAFCEGDDYWIDPLKLQKQVDFMEANPDCSLCSHETKVIFMDNSEEDYIMKIKGVQEPTKYTVDEYIQGRASGFWTVSQIFKKEILTELPNWFYKAPFRDLPLKLIAGTRGKMGYIPETMSVYRRAIPNSWSAMHQTLEWNLKHIRDRNYIYDSFDKYTNYEYHDLIKDTNRNWVIDNIGKIQNEYGRTVQPKILFKYFKYLNKLNKPTIAIWLKYLLGPKTFNKFFG